MVSTTEDDFSDVRDEHLTRPDGRIVAWTRTGVTKDMTGSGITLLRLPGTPGSRWWLGPDRRRWADLGLDVITTERPGFGRSTPLRGRGFAEHADDLAAILDHLGVDRVRVTGISGGGPHVLALASRHPDRVVAATIVVGLSWLTNEEAEQMIELNRVSHRMAREGDRASLEELYTPYCVSMTADPLGGLRDMMAEAPPEDHAVMADPLWQQSFAVGIREAFAQGIDGWVDEDLAFGREWVDIDLAMIKTSLTWWHGRTDKNCPWTAAQRLVDSLPTATLRELPGGHLASFTHGAAILEELMSRQ